METEQGSRIKYPDSISADMNAWANTIACMTEAWQACEKINPDNPLAAARGIVEVVAAAKALAIDAQVRGHGGRPGITTTTALIAALSLLDGGAR